MAVATHPSILTWRIPGTEEPGGLPSMGSHKVGHDWCNLAAAAAAAAAAAVGLNITRNWPMLENFEVYEVKHKGKAFVLFLYAASLVKRL